MRETETVIIKNEIRITKRRAVASFVRGVRAGGDLSDGARGGHRFAGTK